MKDTTLTGPWKAHLNLPGAVIPGHIIKVDDDLKFPVASIWKGGTPLGEKIMLKVAHLVSAAPELLAALKASLPCFKESEQAARNYALTARGQLQFCRGKGNILLVTQSAEEWERIANEIKANADAALAAIAKAEGKKPKARKSKPSTKNQAR